MKPYKGYLVADAHAVYDHLYKTGDVIECGCWAHARRYWYRALESEPELARQGLALIGELFKIERSVADAPTRKREVARDKLSRPVVERFFRFCDEHAGAVLDETPIARAIGYARNLKWTPFFGPLAKARFGALLQPESGAGT
jgi:transposase